MLNHPISADWIASRGREVAPGYKPDVTVRDASGALAFILEAEQKTDRKAFLGDLIKAEMYAEQEGANPTLLIVMQPQPNTTTEQIANHLRPYGAWLAAKKGGSLNLSRVQVISDLDYLAAIRRSLILGSQQFHELGHSAHIAEPK